jgi:hypothetical protein
MMMAFAERSIKPPELPVMMGEEEPNHPMAGECDFLGEGDGKRLVLVRLEGPLCPFPCVPSNNAEGHLESEVLRGACALFTGA